MAKREKGLQQAPSDPKVVSARPVMAVLVNNPCFTYDPKTKAPTLAAGEKVIAAGDRHGVPTYVTDRGRKIYACTIAEYRDHFGPISNEHLARLALQAPPHALAGLILPRKIVDQAKDALQEIIRAAREALREQSAQAAAMARATDERHRELAKRRARADAEDDGEADAEGADLVDVATTLGKPSGEIEGPPPDMTGDGKPASEGDKEPE